MLLALLFTSGPAKAENYTLWAGTELRFRLSETLTTSRNHVGDRFSAVVNHAVLLNGQTLIPAGSLVQGRIMQVKRPGRFRGVGRMRITPDRISLPSGRSYDISAELVGVYMAEGVRVGDDEGLLKGPNSHRRDAMGAALGGVVGAGVGALTGAVGTGLLGGAVVGWVSRLATRGQDLVLPAGTELAFELTRPVQISQQGLKPASLARRLPTRSGGSFSRRSRIDEEDLLKSNF
jgi:hypothetical protein